jgi:DNA-binding transcriptional MerR regulator
MPSNKQYIENICYEIRQKGGTPTVGLIRSRSTRQLPIKDVIEALKHWKNNPTKSLISQLDEFSEETNKENTLQDRVTELEKQVRELKQQLLALKSPDTLHTNSTK